MHQAVNTGHAAGDSVSGEFVTFAGERYYAIRNVDEIAAWLKAHYIVTEWRPVPLKEGILLNDEIQYKDGDAKKIDKKTRNPAINLALNTVKTGG